MSGSRVPGYREQLLRMFCWRMATILLVMLFLMDDENAGHRSDLEYGEDLDGPTSPAQKPANMSCSPEVFPRSPACFQGFPPLLHFHAGTRNS